MANFGTLIKQSRDNLGLTVRALADSVGKSPGYISRIEVQDEIPTIETVIELSKVLKGNTLQFLECAKRDSLKRATMEVEAKFEDALARYRKRQA